MLEALQLAWMLRALIEACRKHLSLHGAEKAGPAAGTSSHRQKSGRMLRFPGSLAHQKYEAPGVALEVASEQAFSIVSSPQLNYTMSLVLTIQGAKLPAYLHAFMLP
eukprot:1139242-Pelagomonas_calceolata.AAC.3